jgi:putative transcriptional regulator
MRPTQKTRKASRRADSLEGQLLIAMPTMTDRWFGRSVVYMCAHTAKGAMGLIINQKAKNISFSDLLAHLEIVPKAARQSLPIAVSERCVHAGGPVETARGFVLHTADYVDGTTTLAIGKDICLTATVDIVRAIAQGVGPTQSLLALGYASWGSGQLEAEFQANGWLHCAADADLVFAPKLKDKYDLAMAKLGIQPGFLVSDVGHA